MAGIKFDKSLFFSSLVIEQRCRQRCSGTSRNGGNLRFVRYMALSGNRLGDCPLSEASDIPYPLSNVR
jgi:hypothetical protein